MFPVPDENFQAPWIPAKRFPCPSWIFDPLWARWKRPVALTSPLSWLFSISGVTSFMRTPTPERARVEKKLTFKPAIKNEKCEIFDFKGPARPLGGGDSWSMRITLGGNLISLISQAEHVRYLAAAPRRPEIRVQRYVYRAGLLQNPGFLYAEF